MSLVLVTVGFVLIQVALPEQHCVVAAQGTNPVPNPISPVQCFDNIAAAIEFATNGQVSLESSATSNEVSEALQAHYMNPESPEGR